MFASAGRGGGARPGMPEPGRAAPHLGQSGLLAKTVFLWFTHPWFGHCQSPGCFAFLAVPHEGHDDRFPKTILVWLMQPVFGHCQSSGMSPPCIPFSAFCCSMPVPPIPPAPMAPMAPMPMPPLTPMPINPVPPIESSLEVPHFGQLALLPKTILTWFTHWSLGHCQSPDCAPGPDAPKVAGAALAGPPFCIHGIPAAATCGGGWRAKCVGAREP
mmetsp:Transcript_56175/g.150349  ORF Transcript_56175/g.150349 Transcript_56175/m.150349 type:complete len:215 (+) Transcript_56175:116-760(+)